MDLDGAVRSNALPLLMDRSDTLLPFGWVRGGKGANRAARELASRALRDSQMRFVWEIASREQARLNDYGFPDGAVTFLRNGMIARGFRPGTPLESLLRRYLDRRPLRGESEYVALFDDLGDYLRTRPNCHPLTRYLVEREREHLGNIVRGLRLTYRPPYSCPTLDERGIVQYELVYLPA